MNALAALFKGLADETRLAMVALLLRHGELCVCDLEHTLGVTQSKASRHLRYLRDAGLLEDRREGLIVNYHLPENSDPEAVSLLDFLRRLLKDKEIVPDAAPLLVQIRTARAMGEAASSVEGAP